MRNAQAQRLPESSAGAKKGWFEVAAAGVQESFSLVLNNVNLSRQAA